MKDYSALMYWANCLIQLKGDPGEKTMHVYIVLT